MRTWGFRNELQCALTNGLAAIVSEPDRSKWPGLWKMQRARFMEGALYLNYPEAKAALAGIPEEMPAEELVISLASQNPVTRKILDGAELSQPPHNPTQNHKFPGEKQPWEMTRLEFAASVERGKLHPPTGRILAGEAEARTALRMAEINGYSGDDLAHFYAVRSGHPGNGTDDDGVFLVLGYATIDQIPFDPVDAGRRELVHDALREGKVVPAGVLADYPDLKRKELKL